MEPAKGQLKRKRVIPTCEGEGWVSVGHRPEWRTEDDELNPEKKKTEESKRCMGAHVRRLKKKIDRGNSENGGSTIEDWDAIKAFLAQGSVTPPKGNKYSYQ